MDISILGALSAIRIQVQYAHRERGGVSTLSVGKGGIKSSTLAGAAAHLFSLHVLVALLLDCACPITTARASEDQSRPSWAWCCNPKSALFFILFCVTLSNV